MADEEKSEPAAANGRNSEGGKLPTRNILETPIKVSGKSTPTLLRQFSKLREKCPNRGGELCLADFDAPQRCEIGLCPFFEMNYRKRAKFLELMENEGR